MSHEINNIKSHIRDINLDIITNGTNLSIDISRRYNRKIRFFYPSRKLIKFITEIGGVLTGSRAIRCYNFKNKPLLERKVEDWDFIVTLDQAFKICDSMKINQIPSIGSVISVKNQRMWRHPDYSDSYRIGPVDVQIIIKDELPDYLDIKGVRVSTFVYSVSQKLELLEKMKDLLSIESFRLYDKHISDLNEIIVKFNSSKLKNKKEI
jgi:hypothetical protein